MTAVDAAAPAAPGAVERDRPGAVTHDLPVLEAYRAGAALLVLLTHVGFNTGASLRGPWAGWLARGDAGVALFFVLSGFLLFRPFVAAADGRAAPVAVAGYLWRRAVRLLPAYGVALLGVLVLVPSSRSARTGDWVHAWTLTSIYGADPLLPGFTQTWSLATEVAFYLALPVLAALWLGRRPRPSPDPAGDRTPGSPGRRAALAAGALVVAALAWRVAVPQLLGGLAPMTWLPAYLDWFAAGMGLAWLREHSAGRRWSGTLVSSARAPGAWLAAAASVYWVATTPLAGPYGLLPPTTAQMLVKHLLYLAFALTLIIPAIFGDPSAHWQRRLTSPPLIWAGTVSYGFFLWHLVVLTALQQLVHVPVFSGYFAPILLLVTLLAGLAAAGSWYLVERPAQRRLRGVVRVQQRRQQRHQPGV